MNQETNTNNSADVVTNTEEVTPEPKETYTQEELDAAIQRESDRRVAQARNKWERREKNIYSEANRLAKMDEDQRAAYELEQREKALEARERELTLATNKTQCAAMLTNRGIDLSLVDIVVSEDADEMNDRINKLEKVINTRVNQLVLERVGTTTPAAGNQSGVEGMTRSEFMKLPLKDQMKIYTENPELYNKLTQ